jgi:hypothetical protein
MNLTHSLVSYSEYQPKTVEMYLCSRLVGSTYEGFPREHQSGTHQSFGVCGNR